MNGSSKSAQHSAVCYWTALLCLSHAQDRPIVLVGPLVAHGVLVIYALSWAQGAMSSHASIVHYRDISPMSRHRKSHISGFSVATKSLEKSVARVAQACRARQTPCGSLQKNIMSQHHLWNFCRDIKSYVVTGMSHPWEISIAT